MSVKIGIISDPHAHRSPLKEALDLFTDKHVDTILCAGDIAGYGDELLETVQLLIVSNCQSILGNHEIWYQQKDNSQNPVIADYFEQLPLNVQLECGQHKIYMVHASPPDLVEGGIRLFDKNEIIIPEQKIFWSDLLADFGFDILIVGHTHQVFAEQLGNTLVINPGSTAYNNSCAILSLPEMKVEFFPLSNKAISKIWNWGSNQIATDK